MLEMPETWVSAKEAANREWNQSRTKKFVAVNRDERTWRSEEHFDIRYGDLELFAQFVFYLVWSIISSL